MRVWRWKWTNVVRLSNVGRPAATAWQRVQRPAAITTSIQCILPSWEGLTLRWMQMVRPLNIREGVRTSPVIFSFAGGCPSVSSTTCAWKFAASRFECCAARVEFMQIHMILTNKCWPISSVVARRLKMMRGVGVD